jgi:hypothetical protein
MPVIQSFFSVRSGDGGRNPGFKWKLSRVGVWKEAIGLVSGGDKIIRSHSSKIIKQAVWTVHLTIGVLLKGFTCPDRFVIRYFKAQWK